MRSWRIFWLVLALNGGLAACAHAQATLVRGQNQTPVSLEEALSQVRPGSIVLVGENHDLQTHHDQELAVMQTLRARGLTVAVGMEFFSYIYQAQVDAFRAGTLAEADFLRQIQWGRDPFSLYRDQALFASASEGAATVALNAPMSLTGVIAKKGLGGLTPEQAALLPPQFSWGRDSYKQRFFDEMGGLDHLPNPQMAENYFAAQSVWDDTMAWRAVDYLTAHPTQVLVIVVGEFHVQYGGGLPDRLRARGNFPLWTLSMINTDGLSAEEVEQAITPSAAYGARADYIWYGVAH